ncbi:Snf7 family protein [Kipferlia bialata]|uniref:Snf7 family protein n=1 Tax=Kipferlia bialata TaxID=797122 RepID=A0A9K3CSS9_9EUKA|nr:Snf7 family protein [Kipferlia bialata]|eukprot:g3348.t1
MGAAPSKVSVEDQIFDMRFQVKHIERQSAKERKAATKLRAKIKHCLTEGDRESAAIYANMSVAKTQQANKLLRLSAQIEMAMSNIETGQAMQSMNVDIGRLNTALTSALSSMDPMQMDSVMDRFQTLTGELGHATAMGQTALSSQTATSAPVSAVDSLIEEVGLEAGLEVGEAMGIAPTQSLHQTEAPAQATLDDNLSARLAGL